MRQYTGLDKLIHSFDQALRSLVPGSTSAHRENPGNQSEAPLAVSEARHVAGLMRVNHSGEVCAQALYHCLVQPVFWHGRYCRDCRR